MCALRFRPAIELAMAAMKARRKDVLRTFFRT